MQKLELALEVPSPAAPEALEVAIPAHMTPLWLQLWDIKGAYKCQIEGYTEGPSSSHAAICAHIHRQHLGVRLACPSCNKTFFNLVTLRCHKNESQF